MYSCVSCVKYISYGKQYLYIFNSPIYLLSGSGFNCTEGCDEDIMCPSDSIPTPDNPNLCVCEPSRCIPHSTCQSSFAKPTLKRIASKMPGDCCDTYECVPPPGTCSTSLEVVVHNIRWNVRMNIGFKNASLASFG